MVAIVSRSAALRRMGFPSGNEETSIKITSRQVRAPLEVVNGCRRSQLRDLIRSHQMQNGRLAQAKMLAQHVSLQIVVGSTGRKIQTRFADGHSVGEKGDHLFPIALLISAQWMDAYTGPDQWKTAGQLNCRE